MRNYIAYTSALVWNLQSQEYFHLRSLNIRPPTPSLTKLSLIYSTLAQNRPHIHQVTNVVEPQRERLYRLYFFFVRTFL